MVNLRLRNKIIASFKKQIIQKQIISGEQKQIVSGDEQISDINLKVDSKSITSLKLDKKYKSDIPLLEYRIKKIGKLVWEVGFFNDCCHFDKNIFENSSLNMYYKNCPNIVELIKSTNFSKYNQPDIEEKWRGIVIPLQVSRDKSILDTGGRIMYWKFIKSACKKYKNNLFLKFHPKFTINDKKRAIKIAETYGSKYGYSNLSVIKNCTAVLTYCSTFCVDAMVMGVPVYQYAKGYFYHTDAVQFTNGKLPDSFNKMTVNNGYHMVNFLASKYCTPIASFSHSEKIKLLSILIESNELFPLPIEYSYYWKLKSFSN